ncbi:MAG TPA: hypothetical protein VIG07_08140 [Methylomirabilota bacterium]
MRGLPTGLYAWAPTTVGLLALLALVSLPVELAAGLMEHPVVAPSPVVTLLNVGSCLLLVWSGLGLRRLEAARARAQRPSPGA